MSIIMRHDIFAVRQAGKCIREAKHMIILLAVCF